ncbi:MAG: ribosomal protein S18-alanine N-acetyltransferase [Eubacterium sp.]|jgi:ribosomal-protein-alanine N-acetyltransferase|nr:ribosomal protein S18-alanine N-acetyltransferase [Eubacterium sp.]
MKRTEKAEVLKSLEDICFKEPWSLGMLVSSFEDEHSVIITHDTEGEIVGYVIGRCMADECELYRICVLPEFRKQGIGTLLIREFIEKCKNLFVKKIFLEVASRNLKAISLYESCGFKRTAMRKGYYRDDDAVVYSLKMLEEGIK